MGGNGKQSGRQHEFPGPKKPREGMDGKLYGRQREAKKEAKLLSADPRSQGRKMDAKTLAKTYGRQREAIREANRTQTGNRKPNGRQWQTEAKREAMGGKRKPRDGN